MLAQLDKHQTGMAEVPNSIFNGGNILLPPATKLGQGNIFRSVCPHSVHGGGACMVSLGGAAWLLGGVCMVALGEAWLLQGGMCGCSRGHVWLLWGACMVAPGACMVAPRGACMVALGGCAWLLGGMHGCSQGGCVWLLPGGHAWDMRRYGDTVNEQAVRILLECILVTDVFFCFVCSKTSDVNIANFVQFVKNLIT